MNKKETKNSLSRGQISIFFSTTIVVMITFIAFIINIGIFVKAKINLQNATDAAAYAGASVQARQLTNIAHLNWEMRNIYKQWMFKYYVLGSLSLEAIQGPPPVPQSCRSKLTASTDFTMSCYGIAQAAIDRYNFPSTCIDFANTGGVGMCTRYVVPGLPRFEASNILGMDETTNAFIDSIVSEKSKDCSKRSQMNFYTANTWAYNVNGATGSVDNITDDAPQIAADQMGAFPQAFEIGLRIRNLEAQVNTPPMQGVCITPGEGVNCSQPVNQLSRVSSERTLKAFQSGWRNIGKNENSYMKNTFTITEVPPRTDDSLNTLVSLSTLLIPEGSPAKNKYYLDLKIMPINYAVFYTSFITTKNDDGINVDGAANPVASEGQCDATKVGLPVPGYPIGFAKNPDYLTYYAVEGKSKFIGMFNPFSNDIVLTAYAAAKPFGGRVGPMLFNVTDPTIITSRQNKRSSPYIAALKTETFLSTFGDAVTEGVYKPGMPVPINIGSGTDQFWLRDANNPVGGNITGNEITFGMPNLLYDYPDESNIFDSLSYYAEQGDVELIAYGGVGNPPPKSGLYNIDMFNKFKALLPQNPDQTLSPEIIANGILLAKAPTLYDAHNYLVPTPASLNQTVGNEGEGTDSWGHIATPMNRTISAGGRNFDIYPLEIYAPLVGGADTIYASTANLLAVLKDYIDNQSPALTKYASSMNLVAADIFENNKSRATGQNTGAGAARAISDLTDIEYEAINIDPSAAVAAKPTCSSMTGKFLYFYSGNVDFLSSSSLAECDSSLLELMESRWNEPNNTGDNYISEYAFPKDIEDKLFTAYRPVANGENENTLSGKTELMIRNFYSTKFIPLNSISSTGSAFYRRSNTMMRYSEGAPAATDPEITGGQLKNPLNLEGSSIDLNKIKH